MTSTSVRVKALVLGFLLSSSSAIPCSGGDFGQDDAVVQAAQHNLHAINAYRAKAGVPALTPDPVLSRFADAGAKELKQTHQPHGHFEHADVWNSGFTGDAAENQGDPKGWPIRGDLNATVDDILKSMMGEGARGGHHDNMLDAKMHRLGVGLVLDRDKLYFTNGFSE